MQNLRGIPIREDTDERRRRRGRLIFKILSALQKTEALGIIQILITVEGIGAYAERLNA